LGGYTPPRRVRPLANFAGARRLFFRPKVGLVSFEVLENQAGMLVRGEIQYQDFIAGIVVNTGELARQITALAVVDGLIPLPELLQWPNLGFNTGGGYHTVLPELGRNQRDEFRFATRGTDGVWRLNIDQIRSRVLTPLLQNGKTYQSHLIVQEASGGRQFWKFSLSIDDSGKATLVALKKVRQL